MIYQESHGYNNQNRHRKKQFFSGLSVKETISNTALVMCHQSNFNDKH